MLFQYFLKATPAWMLQLTPLWMSTKVVEVEEEVAEAARVTREP